MEQSRPPLPVFHCPLSLTHDPPHEILSGCVQPYFESPERYRRILDALVCDRERYVERALDLSPRDVETNSDLLEAIERVHDGAYLSFLREIYDEWIAEGGSKVHSVRFKPCRIDRRVSAN